MGLDGGASGAAHRVAARGVGEKGAERLLGRGHLLAKLEGAPALVYAQVPFAAPEEIDALVRSIEAGQGL